MRNFTVAIFLIFLGLSPVFTKKQTPAAKEQSAGKEGKEEKDEEAGKSPQLVKELNNSEQKIIVTIPDPKRTRLGIDFDRWIDSLQAAAAASGFDFEGQWLPWAHKKEGEKQSKEPGFLLFRKRDAKDADRTLAVYLVGESPALGVDEDQFEEAIKGKGTLTGVIGPSFSGGFESLNRLIDNWGGGVDVITGSATSASAAKFWTGRPFDQTVDTDEEATDAFSKYLTNRGVKPRNAAVLEELDTAYGNEEQNKDFLNAIHATFPRDISALRGAYDSNQSLQESLNQSKQNTQPSNSVPFSNDDANGGSDSIPIQSSRTRAATQDLEMQELSRRLTDDGVSLASLRATNPLDVLFLRQYMAQHDSDLQFYLLEPDILFTHQPEVRSFRGTLAVSRYPRLGALGDVDTRISIFPSKSAEGVYWAVRSLIDQRSFDNPRQIWLWMIGVDRYWPVARLSGPEVDLAAAMPLQPTYFYIALWLAVAVLLAFVTVASFKGYLTLRKLPGSAPRKWFADFFFDPAAPFAQGRRYHAYCFILGLASILLLLSQPLQEAWGYWVYLLSLPAVAGLGFCWPWCKGEKATTRAYSTASPEILNDEGAIAKTLALVITVLVVLAMICKSFALRSQNDDWEYFAAYRSLHLGNGVNPLLPFLLTGLSLVSCAWYQFQRRVFASERFVPLNLTYFGTLRSPYEKVRDTLACYATWQARVASLLAGGLVLANTYFYRSALSIEGYAYDLFVVWVLAFSAFFTVLSVGQFLQGWWHLKDFLSALQELPLRTVFSKLPRELGSVALFSAAPRQRSYMLLLRGRDCLRRIPGLPEGIVTGVETSLDSLLKRLGSGERETSEEAATAQMSFLKATCYLTYFLQREVWCKGESELVKQPDKEDYVALAEEFVALRFLSFIRYATLQLRNLLTYFSVGFILQAMAVSSYPFFSRSLSKMFILTTFSILTGAAGYVLWGMSRDKTLSSLVSDAQGKDYPIIKQTLQLASLPLLTFASTYFPDLGSTLVGWINTAVELGK